MSISQRILPSVPSSAPEADGKIIWKLTLAYDGTDFHGWQVQPDPSSATIQGMLAAAILAVAGEQVLPQGSGRTDAGVHAAAQVASFPLAAAIPPANLCRALNRVLPISIRILTAKHAAPGFHARHSAVGKIYRYQIFDGPVCPPFLARYLTCVSWTLDLAAMQQAAQAVLGQHDFTSFAAHDPDRTTRIEQPQFPAGPMPSNIRRIDSSQWSQSPIEDGAGEQILTYTVRGTGFLHHMVRNLVGTFLEVGRGRLAPADVFDILNARDRIKAGPTAPARGLCLMKVLY